MTTLTPQDLVEHEALKRLKYKYLRCLDQKLWDEMEECFTPDAVAAYSGGKYSYEGRDAILAFLKKSMGAETFLSSHRCHHPEIELTGPDTATAVWALEDVVIEEKWGITIRGAAFYRDEYVKQDGRWRIRQHRLQADVRGDPVAEGRARPQAHRELVGHGRPERAPGGLRARASAPSSASCSRRASSSPSAPGCCGCRRARRSSRIRTPTARATRRRVALDVLARRPLALPRRREPRGGAGRLRGAGLRRRRVADDRRAGRVDAPGLRPPALHERRDAVRRGAARRSRAEPDGPVPRALRAPGRLGGAARRARVRRGRERPLRVRERPRGRALEGLAPPGRVRRDGRAPAGRERRRRRGRALVGRELDRGPGPVVARGPHARRDAHRDGRRLARTTSPRPRRSTTTSRTGVLRVRAEVGFRGAPPAGWRVDFRLETLEGRALHRAALGGPVPRFEHGPPLREFVSAMQFAGPFVEATLRVPRVRAWSSESPALYRLVALLQRRGGPRARGDRAPRRLPARRDPRRRAAR